MPLRLHAAPLTPLLHLTLKLCHQLLGPLASGLHGLTVPHPVFTTVACGKKNTISAQDHSPVPQRYLPVRRVKIQNYNQPQLRSFLR